MASISNLNALIAAAKDSGVVTWDGDLDDILTEISTLIQERGILSKTSYLQLETTYSTEGAFAVVKDNGLWQYVFSISLPTAPYISVLGHPNYYWVMVANFDQVPLSLAGLTDVNISTPISGQTILFNNGANSKWENGDLAPLRIVSPINGQTFKYNTTYNKFANTSPSIVENSASVYSVPETVDVVIQTDYTTTPLEVALPITTYSGKEFTIVYGAQTTGGTTEITKDGNVIFTIDGTYTYSTAAFGVTLVYDLQNDIYVPTSFF